MATEAARAKTSDMQHHEKTVERSLQDVSWWREQVEGPSPPRCGTCWLRKYQCYCQDIELLRAPLCEDLARLGACRVEFYIYYNYAEVGRSANTAHLFEALCPDICTHLIYGDSEAEKVLFDTIAEEWSRGVRRTCMLYPSSSSLSLDAWLSEVKAAEREDTSSSAPSLHGAIPAVRFILLDGTYPGASRIARFAQKAAAHMSILLPCVALDLNSEMGCRSAVAGIMYQPAKDKICTFQAAVLALQQVIVHRTDWESGQPTLVTTKIVGQLLAALDKWIECLVARKIKLGKVRSRASNKDVNNELDERLVAIKEKIKESRSAKSAQPRALALVATAKFTVFSMDWSSTNATRR